MSDALADVSRTFSGQILQSTDAGYEEARAIHNGLLDKRPKLIARCHGLADIAAAVTLARDLNLEIAVRGGGHNVAGRATTDGGVMIDLSLMRGIQVDPAARSVRAQGGATWGLFNRETQLHGLATTGGTISTTGIGGLTLGGGLGWIMGKYALSADNLLSVDVVLADGTIIRASEANHPDLFWGLRGGGGNFGVAASFEYRLHPVGPMITGGIVAHPFKDAWDVLRFYRDATRSLPDECIALGGLIHAPDGSGTKLAAIVACHCGTLADGEAALRRFKSFGAPAIDTMGAMSYCDVNTMLDGGFPRGARNYWKSNFLQSLSDEAIRTMVDCFDACPAPLGGVILEHLHGAVTRIGVAETAFPHRTEGYNLLILSQWPGSADDAACIRWARETHDAMAPFVGAGRYVNYLDDDDKGGAAAAYGPNYQRLRTIKAKYDPDNVFHMNQNIPPAR
ncbi:MAG TPA: FAD-binding oxidoreductase [Acetobacteraceae bacterium]|nr:FAD-binding oxidoreductase [Acetobacteraceae bacterium]